MEGPNLLLNAPTARLGIFHKFMGFNTTLSSGRCGAIDSIEYGVNAIESGEVDVVIAGAVESLSEEYIAWFQVNGLIQEGHEELLSEGAAVVILESEEHAKARGAQILGVVRGVSSVFDAEMVLQEKPTLSKDSYALLWKEMVQNASVTPENIDYVHANHDFLGKQVDFEQAFLKDLFPKQTEVLHLPESMGELYTTVGMMQVIRALDTKRSGLHWIPVVDWFGNYRSILVETREV
jgi:3-oxoacyl-[acyl-carrier-protein] synthase II